MTVEDGQPDYEWRIDSKGKIKVGFGVKRREPDAREPEGKAVKRKGGETWDR